MSKYKSSLEKNEIFPSELIKSLNQNKNENIKNINNNSYLACSRNMEVQFQNKPLTHNLLITAENKLPTKLQENIIIKFNKNLTNISTDKEPMSKINKSCIKDIKDFKENKIIKESNENKKPYTNKNNQDNKDNKEKIEVIDTKEINCVKDIKENIEKENSGNNEVKEEKKLIKQINMKKISEYKKRKKIISKGVDSGYALGNNNALISHYIEKNTSECEMNEGSSSNIKNKSTNIVNETRTNSLHKYESLTPEKDFETIKDKSTEIVNKTNISKSELNLTNLTREVI